MTNVSNQKSTVVATKNPIIPGQGVCDPHMHVFNDRVYLFASHDYSSLSVEYRMQDWQIWSSSDLVTWLLETVIEPSDFWVGETRSAWAVDAASANGKYYFYFSDGNTAIGVASAKSPSGPFEDVLGRPLLDGSVTSTREYDPAVFIDEDGSAYLLFGGPVWAYGEGAGYFIGRLNDDMVSLAETPRPIELDHEGDDKASLNKIGGRYYLTFASNYAIASNVYGPYRYVGNTGASEDHGSYFEWNGQLFNAFTIFDPTAFHRSTGICYVHQTASGHLSVDPIIVEHGVGRYDARWNKIEAEWYMKATGMVKAENPRYGFDVACTTSGTLSYPNVEHLEQSTGIAFFASCSSPDGARIRVYDSEVKGTLLASCEIPGGTDISWRSYRLSTAELQKPIPARSDLYMEVSVHGLGELRIDYFKMF